MYIYCRQWHEQKLIDEDEYRREKLAVLAALRLSDQSDDSSHHQSL